MDAAAMLEQARAMLASNNLPINTANLNRAVMAISQSTAMPQAMNASETTAERPATRSMQSRTRSQGNRTAAAAPSRGEAPARADVPVMDNIEVDPLMESINQQIAASGSMGSNMSPAQTLTPEQLNVRRDAELANMPEGADLSAAFPGGGMGGENVTAGDAARVMLGDNMIPMALTAMAPGMGAAMASARGALPAGMQAERAARMQSGQAATALRDRAIRGINRDRTASGDARGRIPETSTGRRMARE